MAAGRRRRRPCAGLAAGGRRLAGSLQRGVNGKFVERLALLESSSASIICKPSLSGRPLSGRTILPAI